MPYNDPDPTDPMTLEAVSIETDDANAMSEMATCFIEEFLRMGFHTERIMKMFETPGYAGPNLALRTLGIETIRQIMDEQSSMRRPCPPNCTPIQRTGADVSLPVLDS